MKYLPITLIIVLGSSLFVALIINPVLTAGFMKVNEAEPNKKKWTKVSLLLIGIGGLLLATQIIALANLFIFPGVIILAYIYLIVPSINWFQRVAIPRMETIYSNTLLFALKGRNPYWFFTGSIGLLVFSMMLLGAFPPKTLFFPENQPNLANIFIELPIGTDIGVTNSITQKIEGEVLNTIKEYEVTEEVNGETTTFNFMVESVIAQVGEGTSDPNQGPSMAQTPNKAKITVAFVEFKDRHGFSSQEALDKIRENINDYPGAQIVVSKEENGPPAGPPINIEIKGEDYEQLVNQAEAIRSYLNEVSIAGVEELKIDVEQGKPEMPIRIDRTKARMLGVSTYAIGDALRTGLFGKEVSTYKEGEDDYPINLRFQDSYRYNLDNLLNQRITFRDPATGKIKQVPISAVAVAEKSSTFSSVKRTDLDRVITISSNVLDGFNPTETVDKIKASMRDYDLPDGITISFTGEQEEQAKQMAFLSKALLVAVFMIFLIMVAQFNSATTPFIIMTSVVLSLIGVLLGLVIFRMEFVIMMTMIGIISLAGIVVNNAIVLIDYTNLLFARRRKELNLADNQRLSIEDIYVCIVEAGKTRLRPVLLTAITTVLGLVPLAIGLNIDFVGLFTSYSPNIYVGGDNVIFWGPMSWTIIFGLTFATFLTLVVVPVMFYILSRLKNRFGVKVAG